VRHVTDTYKPYRPLTALLPACSALSLQRQPDRALYQAPVAAAAAAIRQAYETAAQVEEKWMWKHTSSCSCHAAWVKAQGGLYIYTHTGMAL